MFPYGQTVTRRRGQTTTSYGVARVDWSKTYADKAIADCAVAYGETEDIVGAGRAGVERDATLYAPHGADITARDRIVVGTDVFDIDGQVRPWVNPFTGTTFGLVATLKKVDE